MTTRRDRWALYYAAAVPMAIKWMQVPDIGRIADDMLAAEEARFGADDTTDLHAALAAARAHALEMEARARAAEMAAEALRAERNVQWDKRKAAESALSYEKGRLAASVTMAELRAIMEGDDCHERVLREMCDAAEKRAAEKRAAAKPAKETP